MARKLSIKLRQLLQAIVAGRSGNATLLTVLGMPVLIGAAGLGVDVSQWYMWKRELQYAVDQAALAGAWARAEASTQDTYSTRANQEYRANLSLLRDAASDPRVSLANFAGGVSNSVIVAASTHQALPFSSFFTDAAPTIQARAQAVYQRGASYTSCLVATDDDDTGALTIDGSTIMTASCGLAALSNAAEAISVNGNPRIDAGWIIAAGGVDPWLKANTDDIILENQTGLYDPFKCQSATYSSGCTTLSPPNPAASQVARTYSCPTRQYRNANKLTNTSVVYTYWKGSDYTNPATLTQITNAKNANKNTSDDVVVSVQVSIDTTNGSAGPQQITTIWTKTNSSTGANATWEKKVTTVTMTYNNVSDIITETGTAIVEPGTYTDLQIQCPTQFKPGVYNITSGGGLKIPGQYTVTGIGVMFVLKNSSYIDFTGGSNVNLTAMQAADLTSLGVSADLANRLAGILVFEDRGFSATNKNKINGTATTLLNGTIYLPTSGIDFAGTASVSSQCLMVAARTIKLTGNMNMTTFCPPSQSSHINVVDVKGTVRLVV